MSSEIKGQSFRPAESARFLHQDSVTGQKINFIQQTSYASASFSLSSGAYQTVSSNLALWPTDIPTASKDASNIIQPDNCIAWVYTNVYIDTDSDGTYFWPDGSALSAGQKKVQISHINKAATNVYSGSSLYSATNGFLFYNGDSGSHTIYLYIRYKYIILEG